MPSFSRMWSEPVPKLSSPQIDNFPASIRFPKNFHPVGTYKYIVKKYIMIIYLVVNLKKKTYSD